MKLDDLNIYDIGSKILLGGAVFTSQDGKTAYLCMYPDQAAPEVINSLEMNLDEWKKFLRQMDLQEVEVLQQMPDGKIGKAIVRKTQRLIEQRVSWEVYHRDGYRCRYCGRQGVPLTVDHLVLWEEMGPSIPENLVAACRKCNKVRGNTQYADWLEHPYYKERMLNLSARTAQANRDLVATLDGIPRRKAERNKR